jgi:hypothetical protein
LTELIGPLAACAEHPLSSSVCHFKEGRCLSSMSAVVGRILDKDWGMPTETQRARLLATADLMERLAQALRDAVEWVERGHNGSAIQASAVDCLLTKGLRRAARAKPDRGGTCNGNTCVIEAAQMVECGLGETERLTHAMGSNDLKRILKAAFQLEENADNLRAAVT